MATRRVILGGPTEETWGESVRRHVLREDHLNNIVRRIEERVAPIGTANTFKKLFDFESVPVKKRDRFRAYCLLVAAGFDPLSFGLTSDDGPNVHTLYRQLKGVSEWISASAGPALLREYADNGRSESSETTRGRREVTHGRVAA